MSARQRRVYDGPVFEYGVRVYRPDERSDLYEERRGEVDETLLRRIAVGIERKRKLLEAMRMVPRHRSLTIWQG